MALVLDADALIAYDRGDRAVAALIEATRRRGEPVRTSSGCVAQAWRGAPKQALLSRLLGGVHEFGLNPDISRVVGVLLGTVGSADVVDAHLALLARDVDTVLTSDSGDLEALLGELNCRARVSAC